MNVEEAIVRLGLDTTSLEHKMSGFGHSFKGKLADLSKSWTAALSVGGILLGIDKVINKYDDLQDRADNLHLSTEFLQGMQQIATSDAVGGVQQFDKAISDLNASLGDAKAGSEAALAKFTKWGITLAEVRALNSEQMFYRISDGVAAIADPSIKAAASFELLGKAGKNLNGILAVGSEELRRRVEAVEKLKKEQVETLARDKAMIEDATNRWQIFTAKLFIATQEGLGTLIGPDFQSEPHEYFRKKKETAAKAARLVAETEAAEKLQIIEAGRQREITARTDIENQIARINRKIWKQHDAELEKERTAAALKEKDRIAQLHELASTYLRNKNTEFQPTLDELATKGIYQQDAQRLQFLQGDAVDAALWGDKKGRKQDLAEIQSIRARLSHEGVLVDPNQGVIDEIKDLAKNGMPVDIRKGLEEG